MNLHAILIFCFSFFSIVAMSSFQLVDINRASKEQLMALPGVGDLLSKRILEYRIKNKKFRMIDELLRVDGFKPALFEKLRDKISISNPEPSPVKMSPGSKTLSDLEIEALLLHYENEPSIQEVQDKAVHYAYAHPSQTASWLARVNRSAWLPKLSTSGGRDYDNGQSVREKVGDADVLYRRDSADWRADVKAEWQLSEIVFSKDELLIARESFRQSVLREDIINQVTRKYFDRRRLQIEQKLVSLAAAENRLLKQIEITERTSELDGWTGGWFSEEIKRRSGAN